MPYSHDDQNDLYEYLDELESDEVLKQSIADDELDDDLIDDELMNFSDDIESADDFESD